MPRFVWSTYFRAPLFVGLFVGGYWASLHLPILSEWTNEGLVLRILSDVSASHYEEVSTPAFAYALACTIVATAGGLALSFLISDVLVVRLALWLAKRPILRAKSRAEFKEHFAALRKTVAKDGLVGFAWDDFANTCVIRDRNSEPVLATARPQSFLNIGLARDRLFSLKLMPTIPGYFVGIGLLLTFIGLVIALSKAAATAGGGDAKQVTASLGELLNAATFKFSTSIAGLFSSIALSILFRVYSITIERGFDEFSRDIENRVRYWAPQTVAFEALQTQEEQLHNLKEINDVQFFQRFGRTIEPALQGAMTKAIEPLTAKLEDTVDKLNQTSQTGVEGLLRQFTDSMHQGAGKEIREVALVLGEVKDSLKTVQSQMSGSGEDFSRRMFELADKFGEMLAKSSGEFATARTDAASSIAAVSKEAATAVQDGLARVLEQLGTQMGAFQTALSGFQETLGRDAERASTKSREAIESASAAAAKAAADTADGIKSGLGEVVAQMRADAERMSLALKSVEASLVVQAKSIREAESGSNAAASAFARVAETVAASARPLLQSSEQIASASTTIAAAARSSVDALAASQHAARELAESLQSHHEALERAWTNYSGRFENIDQSLATAVQALAQESTKQQENIARFVRDVDEGCAKAVVSLRGAADAMTQNTEDLSETLDDFLSKIRQTV